MPPQKRHLFQVNHHAQASIMLLSIMDGAELDLNNSLLSSSSSKATSTSNSTPSTSTISTSDEYDKGKSSYSIFFASMRKISDLQLAAELGRCLLERNQELQSYLGVLQKQIDDEQCDIKVSACMRDDRRISFLQLLHVKLESTREQLEAKCKQTEVLDAMNIDLERELAQQRRDSERDRQRIKEYVFQFKLRHY